MTYTKVGPFVNDALPALNATNLNQIEQGIVDATKLVDGAIIASHYGVVGDGTTNDRAALMSAIAVGEASNRPVYLAGGKVYKLNSGISYDGSKTALISMGGRAIFDFQSVTTGTVCVWVYGTGDFTFMHWLAHAQMDGIVILVGLPGGVGVPKTNVVGLRVGWNTADATYTWSNNMLFRNGGVIGAEPGVQFYHFAWRTRLENMLLNASNLNIPSDATQMGENISVTGCFVGNCGDMLLYQGEVNFSRCSLDNVPIRLMGETYITFDQCHFEAPGNPTPYRFVSLEHTEASCAISKSIMVLNNPSYGTWNKAIFNVTDTCIQKGLNLDQCHLFQQSHYQPEITDGNRVLVAGKGRVEMRGNINYRTGLYQGFAIADSMNLIYNGDAEVTTMAGWTTTGTTGTVTNQTTTFRSGTRAFKLSAAATQTAIMYVDVPVKPGQWVYSVWWRRCTLPTGAQLSEEIRYYTAGGVDLSLGPWFDTVSASEGSWTVRPYGAGYVPKYASFARVKFQLFGPTSGTADAYFDDIIVNVV